jgi:hypothetical protein
MADRVGERGNATSDCEDFLHHIHHGMAGLMRRSCFLQGVLIIPLAVVISLLLLTCNEEAVAALPIETQNPMALHQV